MGGSAECAGSPGAKSQTSKNTSGTAGAEISLFMWFGFVLHPVKDTRQEKELPLRETGFHLKPLQLSGGLKVAE
jgi:hypothetical protein